MKRKSLTIGMAGLAGLSLCGALLTANLRHHPARADAANYSNAKRSIRACVLVTEATQDTDVNGGAYPSNITPHLFYALDSRADIKPAGFDFLNPLAPELITQDIYNRWSNRNQANGNKDRAFVANTNENALFRVGAPCTKNMGAYWEVNLSKVTAKDLQQFDIALIALHGTRFGGKVQFTPTERERLRHFVDQGGTVWLENEGEGKNAFGASSFFETLDIGNTPAAGNNLSIPAPHHPLVNYPYLISQQDAYGLSVQNNMGGNLFVDPAPANVPLAASILSLTQGTVPIIQKGGATTVFAGDYGAGHVLISSANIAGDINNYLLSGNTAGSNAGSQGVVGGFNDGAVSGDNLQNIPPADLKFAYNLASWISSVPAPGSNQRRTGSTQENIGATLATKWAPLPLKNPSNVGSGASIYKGLTFWVDGNNFLHAFDTNPQQSLSNNNNPDDGIPDLKYGFPYDEVWNDTNKRQLPDPTGARVSTPSVFAVTDPASGAVYENVVVAATNGSTYLYNVQYNPAAPTASTAIGMQRTNADMQPSLVTNFTPAGTNPPLSSASGPFGNPFPKPVPAPAYSDGILFTLSFTAPPTVTPKNQQLGWRIEAIDLLQTNKSNKFTSVFGNTNGGDAAPTFNVGNGLNGFFNPVGSLTVGEVKDPSTEAVDRIVYVPCAADGIAQQPGNIHGVWFSTRNEQLRQVLNTTVGTGEFPIGRTFMAKGQRARIPWYANDVSTPSTINLNPIVHVVTYNGNGSVANIQTLRYKTDFAVSYKPDGEYSLSDPTDPTSMKVFTEPRGARMHVIFNTFTPGPNDDVRVDYTVNWPGIQLPGGYSLNAGDMATFTGRGVPTYTPGYNQMTPEFSGGVALSGDDNLIFAETNLRDMSETQPYDFPLEDRIFSARDQLLGVDSSNVPGGVVGPPAGGGATRQPGVYINWMFSPVAYLQSLDNRFAGGIFGNYQMQPRLLDPINKQPVYNFKAIGSPITSNGTVYVLGEAWAGPQKATMTGTPRQPDYTVMMALRENVDATIDVGPLAQNGSVRLLQPSFLHPNNPITLQPGIDFTLERVDDTVNGGVRGIAHISRFRPGVNGSEDTINLALPIWVESVGAGGATTPMLTATPLLNKVTGFGILDNLQYYVVIPRQGGFPGVPTNVVPTSGPSVSGNTLYFAADAGNRFANGGLAASAIISIDLQRAVNSQGGKPVDDKNNSLVAATSTLTDVTTGGALASQYPSIHPPMGTTNIMMASNAQSVMGLDNGLILIADSHRLLEVDAGNNANWVVEATRSQNRVGSANLTDGGQSSAAIALSHPLTAQRFSLNDFLVVDSGNNRIVGLDRGGIARFELHNFSDGLKFLRPGDSLAFNQPSDVQVFPEPLGSYSVLNRDTGVTYTYNTSCFVQHYLVADSGNYRILDIVDVYDANGQIANLTPSDGSPVVRGEKLLVFTTRSLGEQNQRNRYRTVQQFNSGGVDYIVTSVGNVRQANAGGVGVIGNDATNFEGPGGSLLIIQRSATGPNPDPTNMTTLQAGDVFNVINSFLAQAPNGTYTRQKVSNPTWFKEYSVADTTQGLPMNPVQVPRFLLADANGCYVLKYDAVQKDYVTDWMLSAQDYYYLTGRKLIATSIKRETLADLSSRNLFEARFLITNAYSGADNLATVFGGNWSPGVTQGEVVEVLASDYYPRGAKNFLGYQFPAYQRYNGGGINIFGAISRMIPNETVLPDPAVPGNRIIKRSIGTADNGLSTFILEQPQYAERPL